ncbi:MAG: chemotaxis protein CheX [candidate division KSB1 bacterium]|nr:chemotaxis protein CheX [candidate division KSB1 bacterium]
MDVTTLLGQTVPEILSAITGSKVTPVEEPQAFWEERDEPALTAMSGLRGDVNGILALRCDRRTAIKLFERVVVGHAQANEENVRDLLAEILNLVIGQIKAGLLFQGKEVRHSLPSVLSEEGESELYGFESEPPLILDSDLGRFEVHFVPMEEYESP